MLSTKGFMDKKAITNILSIVFSTLLLAIAIFLFYWFQIRPSKIRSDCSQYADAFSKERTDTWEEYEKSYSFCLNQKGL